MGNCLATNKAPSPSIPNNGGDSKSPPPVVYEESVKEVLSETSKHRLLPIPTFHGMLHHNSAAAMFGADDPSDVDSEIDNSRGAGALLLPRPFPAEVRRDKTAGRSPARRPDTSPGRIKPGSGNGRNMGGGDRSGRRSRSPVTASDSGSSKTSPYAGKSPRKTGNYPGRKELGSGDRIRKGKELERETAPTTNELLESSLVSLECFIFL